MACNSGMESKGEGGRRGQRRNRSTRVGKRQEGEEIALFVLKQENNNALWIFGGRVIFQIECTKPILSLMQFTFKTPIPRILLMPSIYQYMTSYMRTVFTLKKENLDFEHYEFHSKW